MKVWISKINACFCYVYFRIFSIVLAFWHSLFKNYDSSRFQSNVDSISSEVTLTYCDPKKEITLQVDASLKGLGAALLLDNKPVAFASKALTDV